MFPIILEGDSVHAALDELMGDEKSKLNALTFCTNYSKDGAGNLQRVGCVQQPVHVDSGEDAMLKFEETTSNLISGYVMTPRWHQGTIAPKGSQKE